MSDRMIFIYILILFILAGIIITADLYLPFWHCPQRVRQKINDSIDNYTELRDVITYYQHNEDEEKLQSLYFLLENMKLHVFVDVRVKDDKGNEFEYDASTYANLAEAQAALDTLEQDHGKLSWRVKKVYRDQETITAALLIENIEEACAAWKTLPWSSSYGEEAFRNYILPYRGSSEPLESFRPYFRKMFSGLENYQDAVQAAAVINDSIKKIFRFNSKYYLHPTDLSFSQMLANGEGRCEDMTNLAMYALRANGIAVTSDYTPFWADSGNNHAWNAIITPAGEAIPFMGCESNPGDYHLRKRIAKVYRKMFSEQSGSLGNNLKENEKAPAWLRGKNYLDVTSDYVTTTKVYITVDSLDADKGRFLYLAVFNSGNWEAIAWSKLDDGSTEFLNIGVDLIYLPVYYINGEIEPAGEVFLLASNGDKEEFRASEDLQQMEVRSTTQMKISNLTGDNDITNLKPGIEYELFYWNKDWQQADSKVFEQHMLTFDNVPVNGLYWLREKDADKEERIFIYHEGMQVWY